MNGRMDSEVFNSPLVLIDHWLVNSVANALALVGLPVANAYDTFDQRDSVKDEEIIEWLGRRGPAGIWVHADDRAKKRHKTDIVSNRISTIWVRRRSGKMPARSQLRLLAHVVPYVLETYSPFEKPFHITTWEHGSDVRPRARIQEYQL